nr:uncharacterized protein LOC129421368 [Misgurnus anguillicaudatus]
MLHISTRTLMLFGTGFLTVLCPVVSIEALPGENVAIWCEHNIHVIADLCWFTQSSYVVPIKIVCMKYTHSFQSAEAKYFSNFTMNQMIMHLYRKSTSLTILSVRVSDSGFYFCGAAEYQIKFGNGSRLEVKDKKDMSRKNDTETLTNDHDKSSVSDDDDCSGNIFLILTFIFGGFIIFTFNILLILVIIRKHRRQRKGFFTVLCPAFSIEVLKGENVTIWCEHNIHVTGKLCWFKQTSYAVPIKIVCMLYTESRQNVEPQYCSNFTMNHMIMDLYSKSTSLKILDVKVSESGLYFCGVVDYLMKFGNGSRLEVKDKNEMSRKNDTETLKNDHDKSSVSADDCSGNIFLILTFIFGGFIIFTFNILLILIIIRKHRRQKQRKAAEHQEQQQDHKEQESDSVEYSAVHFSKKKPKRRERQTDTIDIYQMY